ncbi:hypothetical protein J1N35_015060 [Gossypium stocksii]|uniref:Uncharacterized protein n=1 Tax=Gossypium stocksii TaxID=47602 RepID=A0A9D3VXK5_9ROSI|nr:hypothetical protein J1N35_015060 [Gossypium stocksii]
MNRKPLRVSLKAMKSLFQLSVSKRKRNRPKCLCFVFYSRHRVDFATHQDLCRDIATNMLICSLLQGYVVTPLAYVATLKVISYFLHSIFYVVTLDLPCCDITSNVGPKCLLMVSCTLAKYVISPLGLIWPLRGHSGKSENRIEIEEPSIYSTGAYQLRAARPRLEGWEDKDLLHVIVEPLQ